MCVLMEVTSVPLLCATGACRPDFSPQPPFPLPDQTATTTLLLLPPPPRSQAHLQELATPETSQQERQSYNGGGLTSYSSTVEPGGEARQTAARCALAILTHVLSLAPLRFLLGKSSTYIHKKRPWSCVRCSCKRCSSCARHLLQ